MYNDPVIRSDLAKINKDRRIKIRILMIMDEMEGRISRFPTWGRGQEQGRSSRILFLSLMY
jgi:hypothetical protein